MPFVIDITYAKKRTCLAFCGKPPTPKGRLVGNADHFASKIANLALVGKVVEDISYTNSIRYFGLAD